MAVMLKKKEGQGEPCPWGSFISMEDDDTKVTAISILGSMPSKSPIRPATAKIINDYIKYQLRKEVRKFGRKFEQIFILLEEVQGPPEVRKQFVEFTIKEAARFKRQVLIQELEKVLNKFPPSSQQT
ncbi:integrator complex subunit 6-like [Choloepus didactylus]|uniref:integrator complex subunit 6-like n=1 Tax=Choloepus didactylus TaxID=27675 RepID=UPI00189D7B59|nr:integrator complex subunit 6-like [Choloepus didactylus]